MNQKLWWYTVRASGLIAWALVAASVLWGLLLSSRVTRRPRPQWVLDLHRFLGGLACAFLALHLAGLLADSYVGFDVGDLLVPYASPWRPGALAWGILALYVLIAVEASSLAMRHLPRRAWHGIHLLSFVAFGTVTAHALSAGADASEPWMRAFALGSSIVAVLLLGIRASALARRRPRRPTRSALVDRDAHEVHQGQPDAHDETRSRPLPVR